MGKKLGVTLLAILLLASLGACRVRQTEEGKLPDVEVTGGEMPKYDVDTAEVDVSTSTATITTPDVDISTETTKVTIPDVDVKMPPPEKKPPQQQ